MILKIQNFWLYFCQVLKIYSSWKFLVIAGFAF